MSNLDWTFYQDTKKEWRWKAVAANGRIVGSSSEGFKTKDGAIKNAKLMGYTG